jgi:hypothetical protein
LKIGKKIILLNKRSQQKLGTFYGKLGAEKSFSNGFRILTYQKFALYFGRFLCQRHIINTKS